MPLRPTSSAAVGGWHAPRVRAASTTAESACTAPPCGPGSGETLLSGRPRRTVHESCASYAQAFGNAPHRTRLGRSATRPRVDLAVAVGVQQVQVVTR